MTVRLPRGPVASDLGGGLRTARAHDDGAPLGIPGGAPSCMRAGPRRAPAITEDGFSAAGPCPAFRWGRARRDADEITRPGPVIPAMREI